MWMPVYHFLQTVMCEQPLGSQKSGQSDATRLPRIVVLRGEGIFPALKEIMVSVLCSVAHTRVFSLMDSCGRRNLGHCYKIMSIHISHPFSSVGLAALN